MSRKSPAASLLILMLVLAGAVPSRADTSLGSGVLVRSPLGLAVIFNTTDGEGYALVAFHESSESARIVLTQDADLGIAPIDDVMVPASSLSLFRDETQGLWKMKLKATLQTLGDIDLLLASTVGFDSKVDVHVCDGFYAFTSPSGGLNRWGNLYGTVDGGTVQDSICKAWGTDISGPFTNPPIGTRTG